ncbi:MAG: hypothetical protein ACKVON_17505 [Beijerinckiaceae bacterium]
MPQSMEKCVDSLLSVTFAYITVIERDSCFKKGSPLALFIILSGALLILGGGASLLYGFEIVVTERGSAMVIAGTVALTGGVIAVGIGLTLLRMSQILRSLNPQNLKPKRSIPERPVLPIQDATSSQNNRTDIETVIPAMANPAASLAPEPRTTSMQWSNEPLAPEMKSDPKSGYSAGALAAGGLAAGGLAAAAIAGTMQARSTETVSAEIQEPDTLADEALLAHARRDNAVDDRLLQNSVIEEPGISPEDLEAELALALAESDLLPSKEPEADPAPTEELPRFLHKSGARKGRRKFGQADKVSEGQIGSEGADVALDESAFAEEPVLDISTPSPAAESHDNGASKPNEDGHQDDVAEPIRPAILGTYNSGGRTYTMYADGTVEAMTENGIQYFSSMEELRIHLSLNQ